MYVGLLFGQSAHVFRSDYFRFMEVLGYSADFSSRRCGGGFVRVRGWCLSAVGWCVSCGRGAFRTFLVVSLLGCGIPPCSGELSPLSCGAVLLEG